MTLDDDTTGTGVLTAGHPGDGFRALIGNDPCEVAPVRDAVGRIARGAGFGERAADLVLALDELLANAQEHGRPPIEVLAWTDGRLVVLVTDRGGGFSPAAVWRTHPPAPLGRRGRGLWIARQLTDCVHIDTGSAGTRVRIELSPEPHIGA